MRTNCEVSSCEICKTLIKKTFTGIEKFQLLRFGHVTKMPQERWGEAGPAGYVRGQATQMSTKHQVGDYIAHLAWFVLAWSQQCFQRLLNTVRYS